jgi:hypothetical protein
MSSGDGMDSTLEYVLSDAHGFLLLRPFVYSGARFSMRLGAKQRAGDDEFYRLGLLGERSAAVRLGRALTMVRGRSDGSLTFKLGRGASS